ncbi:uncharacterized protein LOC109828945 isoform X2 [Asparagus officinalis]|uniref:uncharacterized protein LOC109828945 isoform X2 n=1 Tax=Asparagus officinalis TaxID=4686 RepID=UPI00098E4062|nr:uncharacterized protein LOC109828945 isoform X2 [Asparagus officinalis]
MDNIFSEIADDDSSFPLATTIANKLKPKPRFKPKKPAATSTNSSDSTVPVSKNEEVNLRQDAVVESKEPLSSVSESNKNSSEVDIEVPHGETHVSKSDKVVSKMSIAFDVESVPLIHPNASMATIAYKSQPKPCLKPKKPAATFSNSSAATWPDVIVECKEPCIVSESESNINFSDAVVRRESEAEKEVPHGETHVSEVLIESHMEVGPLFHPDAPMAVAEPVSASHLCSSGSVAMDISSVVSEAQEAVNLSSGLLSHEVASQDISQVSKWEGNLQSDPAKPEKAAMPVLLGMELHADIFSESTDIAVKKVSKFQPKAGSRQKKQAKSVSFILPDAADTAATPVEPESVSQLNEEESMSLSFSPPDSDKAPHTTSIISDNVDFQLDQGSANEKLADFSDPESFESILTTSDLVSGKVARKLQPRRGAKTKTKTEKSNSSDNTNDAKENSSHLESLPMDTEALEDHNLSVPTETLRSLTDEQAEPVEMSSIEAGSPEFEAIDTLDGDPWHDEEQAEAENRDVETLNNSQMDEDLNDDDYRGEDKPKQKRQPKRVKKQMIDAQEPSKRLKKTFKEPDSTEAEPPKKRFPHGTRRKRRQLDKALLETPDYEIDRRQIAIKQLILLGEANEKNASKEATASGNNGSNIGSFPSDTHYDPDNLFDEDLYRNANAEEEHLNRLRSIPKVNYHSHMTKLQRGKWSKSETELFYEAIRQFGTDFGMIERLFPNRTRHQVKLKFKSEERRHPSELRDAMSHRSKDLSHFETVIQQLKAQAEEESRQDDANDEPTSIPQETADANKEARDQLEKEEQEANEFEEVPGAGKVDDWNGDEWNGDEWKGDDTTDLNEYEDIEWNIGASPQNEEKYSEYDEYY